MKVKFKRFDEHTKTPIAAHQGDLFDLTVSSIEFKKSKNVVQISNDDIMIMKDGIIWIKTGIGLELPKGYHAKLYARSSTGAKKQLMLLNGTGIIDTAYRGEICAILKNVSGEAQHVEIGERICQLEICKIEDIELEEVEEISTDTARGSSGFGSTGKH